MPAASVAMWPASASSARLPASRPTTTSMTSTATVIPSTAAQPAAVGGRGRPRAGTGVPVIVPHGYDGTAGARFAPMVWLMVSDPTAVFGELVRRTRDSGPGQLAPLVADAAAAAGLADAVIYLADYGQTRLVPVPYQDMPARLPLGVDGTLAGRAYRTGSPLAGEGADEATRRLWLPLREGCERLGVLEATVAASDADAVTPGAALFADLVAMLVATHWPYGDVFELVRRVRPMRLPAEIQWRLLPPTTVRATGVSLSGLLEPWDEVGGDAFDYALNDGRLHVALFDAMGHGLGATLLSTLAVGAYRNARRERADLAGSYEAIDVALATQFGRAHFATGLLLDVDVVTGTVRWLTAGHLPPLLIRHERAVHAAAGPAGDAVRAAVHRGPPAGAHAAARTGRPARALHRRRGRGAPARPVLHRAAAGRLRRPGVRLRAGRPRGAAPADPGRAGAPARRAAGRRDDPAAGVDRPTGLTPAGRSRVSGSRPRPRPAAARPPARR